MKGKAANIKRVRHAAGADGDMWDLGYSLGPGFGYRVKASGDHRSGVCFMGKYYTPGTSAALVGCSVLQRPQSWDIFRLLETEHNRS